MRGRQITAIHIGTVVHLFLYNSSVLRIGGAEMFFKKEKPNNWNLGKT